MDVSLDLRKLLKPWQFYDCIVFPNCEVGNPIEIIETQFICLNFFLLFLGHFHFKPFKSFYCLVEVIIDFKRR